MKIQRLIACLAAALFFTPIFSQKDTTFVSIRTETGGLVQQSFVDEYDFVFLNKEPLRFLAKWNAVAALPVLNTDWQLLGGGEGFDNLRLEGAVEVMIGKGVSVNALANLEVAGEQGDPFDEVRYGLEPRFYFKQNKRIREGKSASTLAGPYFGLRGMESVNLFRGSSGFWPEGVSHRYRNYEVTARFGIQQRIFKNGYIDFSWGLGGETRSLFHKNIDQTIESQRTWHEHFDQQLTLGYAFGSPRPVHRDRRVCDFFKCYLEENRMVKLDLLSLIRTLNTRQQSGKLSFAVEQKINESAYSVQGAVHVLGGHSKRRDDYRNIAFGAGASVEPRWYYTQKKRIATGRSGNNLNGVFVGMHLGWQSSRELDDYENQFDVIYLKHNFRLIPIWGIQYRIFDRGFFEYRLGLGPQYYDEKTTYRNLDGPGGNPTPQKGIELSFLSELKIGVTF